METVSSESTTPARSVTEPPIDLNDISREACEIVGTMLPLLSFKATLTAAIDDNTVRIRMDCEDAGRIIGRKGAVIHEIQFLLNRILQRRHKTVPRIFLDVNGARELETEPAPPESAPPQEQVVSELISRARAVAEKVRRWGDPMEVGLFNAVDRESIQNFFARDPELEAVSLDPQADPARPQRLQLRVKQKPG